MEHPSGTATSFQKHVTPIILNSRCCGPSSSEEPDVVIVGLGVCECRIGICIRQLICIRAGPRAAFVEPD